jgi:hypothetical protein
MSNGIPCEGWWQQTDFGRQPMRDLRLQFGDGKISGSGYDIVGLFTFAGTLSDQGRVVMIKRYLGQHKVDYVGQYDGEGVLWGDWHIGPWKDRWMIKISSVKSSAEKHADIEELFGASNP